MKDFAWFLLALLVYNCVDHVVTRPRRHASRGGRPGGLPLAGPNNVRQVYNKHSQKERERRSDKRGAWSPARSNITSIWLG